MNTLKITVKIDQKAALLAGRILGATAEVEVSPESIGDQWPALVAALDMSTTPPAAKLTVDDPTPEAVRAVLVAQANQQAADAAKAKSDLAARIAAAESEVAAMESAAEAQMTPATLQPSAFGRDDLYGYTFPGFARELPRLSFGVSAGGYRFGVSDLGEDAYLALMARVTPILERSAAEVSDANRKALALALPELERQKAEKDAADAEKKAADLVARKAANKIKFAARLESGYWEKETGSYNEKRHGAWWCATVDFSGGAKGVYNFGESTGSWGKDGILRVRCAPGDFIAYGQKDLRRPDKSDHYILRMRADGSMEDMGTKAEAYKAYRESQKVAA